jgi:hypothetical protein
MPCLWGRLIQGDLGPCVSLKISGSEKVGGGCGPEAAVPRPSRDYLA